jgi:hypothetical protein
MAKRVAGPPVAPPPLGALMHDTKTDRIGVVMHLGRTMAFLRPRGGGIEWEAMFEDLQTADRYDELRSRVSELNANSSYRWPS